MKSGKNERYTKEGNEKIDGKVLLPLVDKKKARVV